MNPYLFVAQKKYLLLLTLLVATINVRAQDSTMAYIKEGSYIPLYGNADKPPITVSSFYIDKYPVTNAQFLEFVKKHPEYSKSELKGIYAEKNYLYYWLGNYDYGSQKGNAPVTNVSWFAAKCYCECQGKRLPTMDEWEYIAMADEYSVDARTKEEFNKFILSWYEKPQTFLNQVGSTYKNKWGVFDMHGLVWEWTFDFNSIFLSGESRKDKDTDKLLFCGSGSVNASDLMDYAAFMRFAFRGSLKANFTTRNLGFRCAKNLSPGRLTVNSQAK
ncbi:formylglycine-generating enzyme family protein [Solitalea lacus]|uniref:formylglycine-generating enzyme family protein n=1 Tax=Solitalea lacus TaxID=2911172 RepID=UPI001EDBB4E1|nr:formylglycine-generating enzyme family protein [Solitalea lacus]UKJ08510.1 formylglycine-generating enzyme family protein [Solitalea lacus]